MLKIHYFSESSHAVDSDAWFWTTWAISVQTQFRRNIQFIRCLLLPHMQSSVHCQWQVAWCPVGTVPHPWQSELFLWVPQLHVHYHILVKLGVVHIWVSELSFAALPSVCRASTVESAGEMETDDRCLLRLHSKAAGLCSASVTAYVSCSFQLQLEIQQDSASPGELYILTGQVATGDERRYKYGLDIALSLYPRCGWDEGYRTNCNDFTVFASSELPQECWLVQLAELWFQGCARHS